MVLLNEGLIELAERVATAITKGQWGSGDTQATVADTGLETPIAATLLDLDSATASGNSAQFQHTTSSTTGNGNTFVEFEVQFDNGVSLNRSVGASFSKTAAFEVTVLVTLNLVRS